jgi:hypothetical protein
LARTENPQVWVEGLHREIVAPWIKRASCTDCVHGLQHSDCPSGKQGGDLGAFGREQMVGAFENATFGLPVGGVSGVIETQFSYPRDLRREHLVPRKHDFERKSC